MAKPIALAADHGGFELKEAVKAHLEELGLEYIDFGTHSTDSVDYPDMAVPACDAVVSGQCEKALLFCGTGVGISMAANKIKGIRACCCSDSFSCEYTRRHNDANALCMGGRVVGAGLACQLVDIFLNTEFEGGRHQRRIDQITAIEALAARGIIDGKSDGNFDPDGSMTRAEFATIVVRALGLTPADTGAFVDVASTAWYSPYVGAASTYGLINGVGEGRFSPDGTITRQEAAVMVSRAAELCGLETEMDTAAVRNMLAQFPDYMSSAEWARAQLAFCYQEGILSQTELNVRPQDAVTRAEVAQMLFNLLSSAELL